VGLRGQQAEDLRIGGRAQSCRYGEEALPDYVWIQGYDPVKVQAAHYLITRPPDTTGATLPEFLFTGPRDPMGGATGD
jgi:hypothetical protein